jgi:RimJ/RimL family protein N-acetyltransferase
MNHNLWQGQRVRLRGVEPEDWETFFPWNDDTGVARDCYAIPFPGSKARQKKWAADLAVSEAENDNFRWVIENLKGEMVGTINAHDCDRRAGAFSYGLAIQREHWRRGYASEAIRIVLGYFFHELRYLKVTVQVYDFNQGSIQLHQKLGFQIEGRIRQVIFTNGQYFDEILMGLTREEYEAMPPSLMGNHP